jgi:hypothetical protein
MLKGRKPLNASSIKIMKVGDKDLSDIEGRKIRKNQGHPQTMKNRGHPQTIEKSGISTNY